MDEKILNAFRERDTMRVFREMDEIHTTACIKLNKEFIEMLEKAYMRGYRDGKRDIESGVKN